MTDPVAHPLTTGAPDLLEREEEVAALRGAVRATGEGRGSVVVVAGPGGIGKSRLLGRGRDLAREDGHRVLGARCSELERSFPFGAVRQLFEPLLLGGGPPREELFGGAAALAAPLFEPAETTVAADDEALFARLHGLYWLVANLTAAEPVTLVVDDAHWGDEASIRFLTFLAPRMADLRGVLMVGSRPLDDPTADPAVGPLLADPDAHQLRPAPLSGTAITALLARDGRAAPDPAFVDACLEATGGNPFLLRELAGEIEAEGVAPRREAADRVRSLGPAGVAAAIVHRLRRLAPAAIDLARGLAILGDGADTRTVGAFAGLGEDDAVEAARVLEAAGVAEGVDGLRFVHPIVRQSVYQDITSVERGEGHAAAAAFVAERGAGSDAVAAHLLNAPPRGDAGTVRALRSAAARAEALGDPLAAVEHLRRALAEPPADEDRAPLLFELGRAAARAGLSDAAEQLEACLDLRPEPDVYVAAAGVYAELRQFSGRPDLAAAALERGIEELGEDTPAGRRLAVHLAAPAHVTIPVRRRLLPRLLAMEAPDGPARGPEDLGALTGRAGYAIMDCNDGPAAADFGLRALAAELPDPPDPGSRAALIAVAVSLMGAEEHAASDATLTAIIDRARRAGARSTVSSVANLRALVRYRMGDVGAAESDALTALEMLPGVTGAELLAHAGAAAAVWVGIERERPRAALQAILDDSPYRRDPDILPYSQILLARGSLHQLHGEHEAALDSFLQCDRDEPGWAGNTPSMVPWRSNAALSLAALDRADEARRLAADEVALARASQLPRCTGMAERVAALVGSEAERAAGLAAAAARLESTDAPLELARALSDLGAELRRVGDRAGARDALDRAHDLAERMGATRIARRARQELRMLGTRARPSVGQGLAALTPAERRVADLAAAGRSNREIAQTLFVSEKTVETHLARVFRKLDVKSRRQLPEVLPAALRD